MRTATKECQLYKVMKIISLSRSGEVVMSDFDTVIVQKWASAGDSQRMNRHVCYKIDWTSNERPGFKPVQP